MQGGLGRGLSLALACAVMGVLGHTGSALAASTCQLYADSAAPPGGNGLAVQPFNSVQALLNALAPGQTGCLKAGSVFTETVRTNKAATAQAPIRIVSESQTQPAVIQTDTASSERATLRFDPSSAYIEFAGVVIRGALSAGGGSPAVVLGGTGNKLLGTEVTHAVTTCISIGINAPSRAVDAVLDGVSVHGCGRAAGHAQAAGIAISYATGTRLTNSYVYDNPARGVQLYPDAQRSFIANNVIDGQRNGMGDGMGIQFAGDTTRASSDNLVQHNVISNNESYEVGFNWEGPVGTGNVLRENCLFHPQNSNATIQPGGPRGFSEEGNSPSVDPIYVNRSAPPAGYALSPGTPCGNRGPVPVPTTGTASERVDPEAENVFSAVLSGEVDAHMQPATARFEFDGAQAGPDLALAPLALPQEVTSQEVTGLEPSTRYSYRLTARNGGHSVAGPTAEFETSPPPLLAPPVPDVNVTSTPEKTRVRLTRLSVGKLPAGATGEIVCTSKKAGVCPIDARPLEDRSLLLRRRYPAGTTIAVLVRLAEPLGRYSGGAVRLRVTDKGRKHNAAFTRDSLCIDALTDKLVRCLRIRYRAALTKRLNFKLLRALKVPVGSTVSVRCTKGRCIKAMRCRLFGSSKSINLLARGRAARSMRRGSTLEVRVQKPDTVGVVSRITFGKRGAPKQTHGYLRAGTRIPQPCANA